MPAASLMFILSYAFRSLAIFDISMVLLNIMQDSSPYWLMLLLQLRRLLPLS